MMPAPRDRTGVAYTRALAVLAAAGLGLGLAGCGSSEKPKSASLPGYKVGIPYKIKGKTYYPEIDFDYEEEGIASWYGQYFAGKPTANGEPYDPDGITAAHTTLPMPTIVNVKNLENGREMKVRINDRGPFYDGRIIDVSRRVAEKLGFKRKGTARVRVSVVQDESRRLYAMAQGRAKGSAPMPDGTVRTASAEAFKPAPVTRPAPQRPRRQGEVVAMKPIVSPGDPGTPEAELASLAPSAAQASSQVVWAESAPATGGVVPVATQVARDPVTVTTLDELTQAPPTTTAPAPAVSAVPVASPGAPVQLIPTGRLAAPKSLPPTAASPTAPGGQRLFVQAASFADYGNAQRTSAMLSGIGATQIAPSEVGGRQYYRVQVGPWASRADADRALAQVVAAGLTDARILAY